MHFMDIENQRIKIVDLHDVEYFLEQGQPNEPLQIEINTKYQTDPQEM